MEEDVFKSCESGDIAQAKTKLRELKDPAKLVGIKTAGEGRTCLHLAVLGGDGELLEKLVKRIQTFTNEKDNRGDTALHLAVWKYRVDLVEELLKGKANLRLENNKGETPLCIAVKFGFLDVFEKLFDHEPDAVKELCKKKKVLHLAVERNRVKIVKFLIERGDIIKELINQRKDVVEVSHPNSSHSEGKSDMETVNSQQILEGDTPLHIAAKNKNEPIVDLLRKVPGVNKHALNSAGKTPLDVAREVTDYYESFRIIKKLTDYKPNPKPFMYCAPEVSKEKHKRATDMVDKSFADRRNTELLVAALLATMTFTAVFTVPGGSYSDSDQNRGTPILLSYYMFKLFIIFDCIAFFLSLFVCIMWQMASELTTEDKMFFMTLSSLLTCFSFGFNSCGFMAAVHTILAHKDPTLAWVILGILLFIDSCGTIASIHQLAMFAVGRARFHRLCGVPRRLDDFVEYVWERAERFGILKIIRQLDERSHDALEGEDDGASKKAGVEEHEHEHGYNCSFSSSPCLRNVVQSV